MIEHENARLRAQHQQMREQLVQQQQQMEAEKQKHAEKIRKLREQRDQEMDKYHRRLKQSWERKRSAFQIDLTKQHLNFKLCENCKI